MIGAFGGAAARARGATACTIYSFERDGDACRRKAAKRIAILDPFEIEQRLLVALAEAHGHRVAVYRDVEHFLAGVRTAPPQVAFVHMCLDPSLRRAAETGSSLPPIVLIDSSSIADCNQAQLTPFGGFTALRFPIGLHELAEAIRHNTR